MDELASSLRRLRAETDRVHLDRAGERALIIFRDPDNVQWEFFEEG